ncbi:16S rRNA processing protein RimM [Cryomorpha ignava]|uniref:Ribosome maturation factor RimM n=1 Tax=Cryomorpha ignava TaxID=101383 RepID=A0A7K3WVC4_9FLAO|nr:ribosome maturation factor RimM [Cryomorpha ignava]NEN25436.1 16S rRNA processing protein RimM [Cryomorpha ignava]
MIISKDNCFQLGYISKTQGFKGGLIAFFDVDDTRKYAKLGHILVELNGVLTPFFLETVNLKDKNFVHLKIEGVDNQDAANELAGNDIYLPLEDLPKLKDDAYYLHDLIGMTVIDATQGEVGIVEKVLDYNNNPLLQVMQNTDEILIPLIDNFVKQVDKKAKTIHIDVPEDLLDINKA